MIERMRAAAAATLVVAGLAALGGATRAQEPAAAKPGEPAKKKHDAHRVPDHFGQIGLTAEQRNNIYAIQGKRSERIAELQQQIIKERAEMLAQCEGVLTDTQRKLLDNLRRAATEPGGAAKTADAAKSK